MAEMYRPGRVVQKQRWFRGDSDIDRMPPSTGETLRQYAYGSRLNRSSLKVNPKRANGWRDPSAYALERFDYTDWYGTLHACTTNDKTMSFEYTDCFPSNTSVSKMSGAFNWPSTNMVNQAQVEALVKLKEQNVNYAVALAEAHKSITMIEKSFWAVFDAYRYAKKGLWKQAARALGVKAPKWKTNVQNLSGRWLELQYGWLPLLSDVYGMYEDARKGILRWEPRISVTRTVLKQTADFDVALDLGLRASYTHSDASKYGVKVRLDYQLKMDALATASKVGLTNPAIVAWELVPFSFVLDWALPIGNWLNAWDADFGLEFIGGSCTKFSRIQRKGKIVLPKRARQPFKAHFADLDSFLDWFKMERTVYASPPIPVPYWKSPVSASHALNALALLGALFKR